MVLGTQRGLLRGGETHMELEGASFLAAHGLW